MTPGHAYVEGFCSGGYVDGPSGIARASMNAPTCRTKQWTHAEEQIDALRRAILSGITPEELPDYLGITRGALLAVLRRALKRASGERKAALEALHVCCVVKPCSRGETRGHELRRARAVVYLRDLESAGEEPADDDEITELRAVNVRGVVRWVRAA